MIVLVIIFGLLIYASLVGLASCFTKPPESGPLEEMNYHLFSRRGLYRDRDYYRDINN